jgi:epoxyqueuosine reductase
MGNALASASLSIAVKEEIHRVLTEGLADADALVAEHIEWALNAYN